MATGFFFSWNAFSIYWARYTELVFSTPVLPEGGLFFGDQVTGLQVLYEPLVDHALKGLAETAEQAVGPVAGLFLGVFFLLQDRGDDGFFPCCGKDSWFPWLIRAPGVLSCSRPKMLDHIITDSIFAWDLRLVSSDRIDELCFGEIYSHGGWGICLFLELGVSQLPFFFVVKGISKKVCCSFSIMGNVVLFQYCRSRTSSFRAFV